MEADPDQRARIFTHYPTSRGRGGEGRLLSITNGPLDLTDHAYMMKPPSKPKYGIRQLLDWEHTGCRRRCWRDCMPREGIVLSTPSCILFPVHLFCLAVPKLHPFITNWESSN